MPHTDTQANARADAADEPVRIAVFDFDGTSISGNSPVLLVKYLMRLRRLRLSVIARIIIWGILYKLRLPQSEAWARRLVFTAFDGEPVEQTDRFLVDFYDEQLDVLFKPQIDAAMRAHADDGEVVVVVSATFEPIVERAMERHPFEHQMSTRMRKTPAGTYVPQVDGEPVQGEEKLVAMRAFADERYGVGNWFIDHAYGDHHSDRYILSAARHAHAVSPDRPLRRMARRRGWEILDW